MSQLIVGVVMAMISASSVVAQSKIRCYNCNPVTDNWCTDPSTTPPSNFLTDYCNGTSCTTTTVSLAGETMVNFIFNFKMYILKALLINNEDFYIAVTWRNAYTRALKK